MKCEMKRSKMTLVWAVSRKHSEKGETIVPAWTGFQVLNQGNQPKEVLDLHLLSLSHQQKKL